MEHIGPLMFVAARSFLAIGVLAPLALREWRKSVPGWSPRRLLKLSFWTGLAFFGGALFQQTGIVTASVTNSSFLTSLYVVMTPFMAWVVHRRVPTGWVWVAVALSAVGTWLLGGGTLSAFSKGDVLVAISAVFWAAYVVLVGMGSGEGMPSAFTALQFVVVGLLGLLGTGLFEQTTLAGLWRATPDLLFVGGAVQRSDVHFVRGGNEIHSGHGDGGHCEHGVPVRGAGRLAVFGGATAPTGLAGRGAAGGGDFDRPHAGQ